VADEKPGRRREKRRKEIKVATELIKPRSASRTMKRPEVSHLPMNRTVGRVRPGEPPHNVFHKVGSLGQTRPTRFMGSKREIWFGGSLPMNHLVRSSTFMRPSLRRSNALGWSNASPAEAETPNPNSVQGTDPCTMREEALHEPSGRSADAHIREFLDPLRHVGAGIRAPALDSRDDLTGV